MMALLLGTWFTFANPTKTIIGEDVSVVGDLSVGGELTGGLTCRRVVATKSLSLGDHTYLYADCDEGEYALGGGYHHALFTGILVARNYPNEDLDGWVCRFHNYDARSTETVICYVMCCLR